MFYIIKFLISNIVSIILLIFFFSHFYKKFIKVKFVLLFLIFVIFFSPVPNLLVYSFEKLHEPIDINYLENDYDKIVILSGFEDINKTKSFNQLYLGGSNNRIIEGTRVHLKYKKEIIFSGTSAIKIPDEKGIYVAKKFFNSFKIRSDFVIFDENSQNTEETFLFLKKNYKNENHLIVTSAMHMLRCKLLAKKNNVEVILYPVDYKANHNKIYNFNIDVVKNIYLFQYGLREISALLFYKLSGKI